MPNTRGASRSPDTEELLRRLRGGDASAAGALLGRHRDRLRQMVAVRLDPRLSARVDPSDVVQETLLEAARGLGRYADERPVPFYPWLRQIAWERLEKLRERHLRAGRRSVAREDDAVRLSGTAARRLADRLAGTAAGPSQHLRREELRAGVREALERLDPDDRELLVLRFLEQMTAAEIAAVLGVREGTVRVRQLRALERLRSLLSPDLREGRP